MTPTKWGVSTNIGKNFAETLQFEYLAVKNFFLFYYLHIFVKNLELVSNAFFMKVEKTFKNILRKPFEHTMTFSAKCFKFFFQH